MRLVRCCRDKRTSEPFHITPDRIKRLGDPFVALCGAKVTSWAFDNEMGFIDPASDEVCTDCKTVRANLRATQTTMLGESAN